MSKQQPAAPAAATKPTKTISEGVRLGRAIEKLTELAAAEREALAASPAAIRAKFDAERSKVVAALSETQRAAVLAAVSAMATESTT